MWDFSFENGMETSSWCAELAFRTRVSMSAIGSVMVMWASGPSSPRFHDAYLVCVVTFDVSSCRLPGRLRDAGELAAVSHLPQADPAQAELAVDGVRTAAALAARVGADLELRLRVGLVDERGLGHSQFSLKGKPSALSSARPSSSLVAVVTTVMSMPRTRSIRSW